MIQTTQYYDEFLRYSKMAAVQQKECNLGTKPHAKSTVKDQLMKHVKLYDVVERKYAGFTQILLDIWYGSTKSHPYYGNFHEARKSITKNFTGWRSRQTMAEMLFVFMVHRLTGSGINYAKFPSGYHNTVLPEFYKASGIAGMVKIVREFQGTKYTSVGYQFPAFPKPTGSYTRGGDYFICEILPKLCRELANWLVKGEKKDLREVGEWLFAWNKSKGLRAYKFQYAAVISDICDFYPEYVNIGSPFYYGSNALECMKFMIEPGQAKGLKSLDLLMEKAMADTGFTPYNLEDQMCDCIRWIENYIKPGGDYDHLDRDAIWSSHKIYDHPYGRQKPMLDLGLLRSFNDIKVHPADDYILNLNGWSVEQYKTSINKRK